MAIDAEFRWKEHIKKKSDELNIKIKKMYWLLGRNSELSVHNKLMLYKKLYVLFGVIVSSFGAAPGFQYWHDSTLPKHSAKVLSAHHSTFEIGIIAIS
jgi:hypothetical protein